MDLHSAICELFAKSKFGEDNKHLISDIEAAFGPTNPEINVNQFLRDLESLDEDGETPIETLVSGAKALFEEKYKA